MLRQPRSSHSSWWSGCPSLFRVQTWRSKNGYVLVGTGGAHRELWGMCGQIGSDLRVYGWQTQGQWVALLNPKLELHSGAGHLGMAPSTHLACGPGFVLHLPLLKEWEPGLLAPQPKTSCGALQVSSAGLQTKQLSALHGLGSCMSE